MGNFDTIKILLLYKALASGQIDRYNHVENEFDQYEHYTMPKSPRKIRDVQLYKFLHLTRAADTSLQLVVEALHIPNCDCHMKSYLEHLTAKGLHSQDKEKFIDKVVHNRNKFVHAADTYITKHELNSIEPIVVEMLQKTLNCR